MVCIYILFEFKYKYFRKLIKGLEVIEEKLRRDNFNPNLIIAFTRTSGIFAGMLATKMKIEELLVINRRVKHEHEGDKIRDFDVGYSISLNQNELESKKILVVSYTMETGSSLKRGMDYLKNQGIKSDIKIATLYISTGAKTRFHEVFYVFETAEDTFSKLPWIKGEYPRI